MAHAESLNEAGGGEGSAYLGEIKKWPGFLLVQLVGVAEGLQGSGSWERARSLGRVQEFTFSFGHLEFDMRASETSRTVSENREVEGNSATGPFEQSWKDGWR